MAAPLPVSNEASFSAVLPDEHATRRLMIDIASVIEAGDFITLSGDLGAGKTTFARAMIRHLAGDSAQEVPSPTFTLMQIYELPRFALVHADLYRITGVGELAELGFEDLPDGAVVLLEWPDRAPNLLPADRLDVGLMLAPKLKSEFRQARITGYGTFAPKVERIAVVRQFIAESGFSEAVRSRMQGDASSRSYDRLTIRDKSVVLMNAPARPDGAPVRDGRSYSAIAHIADNAAPFVALARGLRERGLSAPEIYHADVAQGLLLLEDLGAEGIIADSPPAPILERYEVAVDALLLLHRTPMPDVLPVAPQVEHRIPRYDIDAFLIEAELILDWYLPRMKLAISGADRAEFQALWREALGPAIAAPATWVLRDYHSPNLLWLPGRGEVARIGLLDFQDALMGPAAYDVASLLQDARVDVAEPIEVALLSRYVRSRRASDPTFDAGSFIKLYVTLAAQRATKILGIFARLDMRDGKPQYLRHMPRIWTYLQRALAHPALASLNAWYSVHIPALKTI